MGEVTPVWQRPLTSLSRSEWESLCDGCGKCCLHKVEDEDNGRIWPTNVACKLLDLKTAQCKDYRNRRAYVPDCLRLTPRLVKQVPWLRLPAAREWRSAAGVALSDQRGSPGCPRRRRIGGWQSDQRDCRRAARSAYTVG